MTNKIKNDRPAATGNAEERPTESLHRPHLRPTPELEYIAPRWMLRKWLTGFTGSGGTLVVTESEAGLWTTSIYPQAERATERQRHQPLQGRAAPVLPT